MHAASYDTLLCQSSDPLNTEVNGTVAENTTLLPCYGYEIQLLSPFLSSPANPYLSG